MQEHVHWGLPSILVYGVGTIILMNVLRIIAGHMVDDPRTETIGKVIGGLITFTAETETAN